MNNKLKGALAALHNGKVLLINQTALAVDALELEFSIEFELLEVLSELLDGNSGVKTSQNQGLKISRHEVWA